MTTDAMTSPYRGLTPYTEADAAYFFGRTRETATVAANLEVSRLTIFYGPSGVGKSSVLRAGVIHQLRQRARRNFQTERQRRDHPHLLQPLAIRPHGRAGAGGGGGDGRSGAEERRSGGERANGDGRLRGSRNLQTKCPASTSNSNL